MLAAIVAIFVYGMIAAMLGTILPELSERFHLSPSQNGTIASAQALGLILASLAVGPLLDNEGKKLGLILGLAFISIALFALPRSPGFRACSALDVPARRRRRHPRDRGECSGQRCGRSPSRHRVEPGQPLLRPRRTRHTVHRRQSFWTELGPPLLHRRIPYCGHAGDPDVHQNARAHRRWRFRARGCGSGARAPTALSDRTFPLSLHRLRSGHMELVGPPSHRAGHPGIARAQHSFAGIRARPADRPRRHLTDSGSCAAPSRSR